MAWDKELIAEGVLAPDLNNEIRANWSALEASLTKEMNFSTGGTASLQGILKQGGARPFFQASAPTTRIDGSAFAETDNGSLWIDSDNNKIYELTDYAGPTWTSIESVTIATLIAQINTWAAIQTFSATPVLPALGNGLVPIGSMFQWLTGTAPTGYLLCQGQAISRTTYTLLYGVIGTTYGVGDNSTTFNIPDLRGYFVRGLDTTQGVDPDYSGKALGDIQSDGVVAHVHRIQTDDYGDSDLSAFVGRGSATLEDSSNVVKSSGPYNSVNSSYIGEAETRPKNIALNYIIKT